MFLLDARNRYLHAIALSPKSAFGRAFHRGLSGRPGLRSATGMVANLGDRLSRRFVGRLENPGHRAGLSPGLLLVRVLAR